MLPSRSTAGPSAPDVNVFESVRKRVVNSSSSPSVCDRSGVHPDIDSTAPIRGDAMTIPPPRSLTKSPRLIWLFLFIYVLFIYPLFVCLKPLSTSERCSADVQRATSLKKSQLMGHREAIVKLAITILLLTDLQFTP